MKTTLSKKVIIGALGLATAGVMSASAMGMPGMSTLSSEEIATRQTAMFTEQASMIGATLDEVKNAWAEGKDFKTLAQEKGITETQLQEKMKAKKTEAMKAHLATLVTKGVITQAQADKRLATMEAKKSSTKEGGRHGKGMRGFFGI